MANYLESIEEVLESNEDNPLLTVEDENRILNEGEFDYSIEAANSNWDDNDLPNQLIDLVLENEKDLEPGNGGPEWKNNPKRDFLEYLEQQMEDSSQEKSNSSFEEDEANYTKKEAATCLDYSLSKETSDFSSIVVGKNCQLNADSSVDELRREKTICKNERKRELTDIQNGPSKNDKENSSRKRPREQKNTFRRHFKGKIHLDEYLLDLLDDTSYTSYIHWTCKEKKEFRLTNSRQIANLWGMKKGKKKFTADKLQRELRNLRTANKLRKLEKSDHFQFL